MKLKALPIMGVALVFLFVVGCSTKINEYGDSVESNDYSCPISVDFEFLQDSGYNATEVKKDWGVEEETQFIFFESANNQETLEIFANKGEFNYPRIFDFKNHTMLIAYGRKVVRLDCMKSKIFNNSWFLVVTFGEEYYDETVFFYKIDKRNYLPVDIEMKCYVMEGRERVYLGRDISDLNWTVCESL